MILRRSQFIHQIPVGENRVLIIHALSQMQFPADNEVSILLDYFSEPRCIPDDYNTLMSLVPYSKEAIELAVKGLIDRHILTEQSAEAELLSASTKLTPTHGRDPVELLNRYRRESKEGVDERWAIVASQSLSDLAEKSDRIDALLFGDCDIQIEADFLRQEAARRGINLHVSATFTDDVRFASEHKHDIIFIGALRGRHLITGAHASGQSPHENYIKEAYSLLKQLRENTTAPILIDNLPEPTVQPHGLAEQGLKGHRTRFRLANVTLSEMTPLISNVYVVDIASELNIVGSGRMLDDGQSHFTHFGSPGWLLQRPEREKEAVYGIFPDLTPYINWMGGNPYVREATLSSTHIDALVTVLGIGRKKCIILDLDGTLWPGVLAETGSPFAWSPEISGIFSYIGLYFGLHEALLCLKERGIVLACVSKNDEATVKELWKYPHHYPTKNLLTLSDFVTYRINWDDKVSNIRSIAGELGFGLDTFLFIDDHPVERDRVRQRLPEVEVWGEDPFALRRLLLNDPRLQLPVITEEAATRSIKVKAQLERQHLRDEIINEQDYVSSLNIQCKIDCLRDSKSRLDRVAELFQRTTQFNTTGRQFTIDELGEYIASRDSEVIVMNVSDKFGDHGLVGACVIKNGDIMGLAISCRVLGMGVEHSFMEYIITNLKSSNEHIVGKIISTPRNIPVRNIYRDHGFIEKNEGEWWYKC